MYGCYVMSSLYLCSSRLYPFSSAFSGVILKSNRSTTTGGMSRLGLIVTNKYQRLPCDVWHKFTNWLTQSSARLWNEPTSPPTSPFSILKVRNTQTNQRTCVKQDHQRHVVANWTPTANIRSEARWAPVSLSTLGEKVATRCTLRRKWQAAEI